MCCEMGWFCPHVEHDNFVDENWGWEENIKNKNSPNEHSISKHWSEQQVSMNPHDLDPFQKPFQRNNRIYVLRE